MGAEDMDAGIALLDDAISGPAGVPRPDAVPREVGAEIALGAREFPSVVEAATHLAVARWAHLGGDETWVREARGMLTFTLRTVLAGALVGDDRIVTDHVGWAESVLADRSRPISLAAEAFNLLTTAMPADLPRTSATARAGMSVCSQPPPPPWTHLARDLSGLMAPRGARRRRGMEFRVEERAGMAMR